MGSIKKDPKSLPLCKTWKCCNPRYLICGLDFTIYPANSELVQSSCNVLATLLAMGSNNIGHIQCPMFHKQTSEMSTVKHTRTMEDALFKNNVNIGKRVALLFDKPPDSRGDQRASHQVCIAASHKLFANTSAFNASDIVVSGRVGPVPLIRVIDFIDYDESCKPGPADRVEQTLGLFWFWILFEEGCVRCSLQWSRKLIYVIGD